jgi:hypothetical protein
MASRLLGLRHALTVFALGVLGVPNSYASEGAIAHDFDGDGAVMAVHTGGMRNVSVAAAGANVGQAFNAAAPVGCLKAAPGYVARAIVTAAGGGSATLSVYDNAAGNNSGTVIGVVKAAAAVGDVIAFEMRAGAGISIPAQAGAPTVTLSFT